MDKKYSKDYFELVDDKERLLDKPLQTKQLSYFQDAMIRFAKNKYNLAATIILIILILFSIFVPIVTPARLYQQTNSALRTLPPKVPVIEHLGILNGTKLFKNQPIDYSTIDPETGLGYPTKGFDAKYIDFSTLKNTQVIGSDRSSQFVGGTNEIIVNPSRSAYAVRSFEEYKLEAGALVEIDIDEIGDGVAKLYLSTSQVGTNYATWDDIDFIGQTTQSGKTTFDPYAHGATAGTYYLVVKYEVNRISPTEDNVLSLNAINIKTNGETLNISGYELSRFRPFVVVTIVENGRFTKTNNELAIAPNKASYSVVSPDPVTIGNDTELILNIDAIGSGAARLYLVEENDSSLFETWDQEGLHFVGSTNQDGEITLSPASQGIEAGMYYIIIKYQGQEAIETTNRLSLRNLIIREGNVDIEFSGSKLELFEEFIIDETMEEGTFARRQNEIVIYPTRTSYSIASPEIISFNNKTDIAITLSSIGDGSVKVYLAQNQFETNQSVYDTLPLLGEISTSGTHTISIEDPTLEGYLVLRYVANQTSTEDNAVGIEHISINGTTPQVFDEEALSTFNPYLISSSERGRYNRKNAVMTQASFKYDIYGALFSPKPRIIGKVEYEAILAENPGMEASIVVNPDNPKQWTFGEGYPLVSVTNYETYIIGGKEYSNYSVMMDGARVIGFDKTPYFFFGTDTYGRDLYTLIWLGLRTSLLLGFMASIVNIIIGIIWGAVSAYYGGQVDILMERFKDVWGSFPQITMIGIISVLIGPGFLALFIFMIYDGWIGAASITRIQFYRYKGREYVLAARTLGANDRRIIFKHILPNAIGTIVTRVVLSIPSVIFLEVNLSYLGFGIGSGQTLKLGPIELTGTSIGVILNEGQQQIFAGNLWLVIAPTIIVSILMISFNMFGNALRDALNPQLRGN